jgi:hypothetical protein
MIFAIKKHFTLRIVLKFQYASMLTVSAEKSGGLDASSLRL